MSQFEYDSRGRVTHMDGMNKRELRYQESKYEYDRYGRVIGYKETEQKELDLDTIQNVRVADIDTKDYPDFCDAFIDYAEHEDGTPLETWELDELSEDRDFVYMKVMEVLT